jgi:hypothetical protein
VFSDDVQHLKELINNIDSENVWSKSVEMSSFLDKHFSASNVSLLVNTPQAWKHFFSSVSPEIKKSMQDNPEVLKNVSPVLFQFNRFQDKIYTNIVFSHDLNKEQKKDNYRYEKSGEFELAQGIAGIHYAAFSGNKAKLLVQDSSNAWYLISNKGALRKDTLSKLISANAVFADLDKNGRKDFVFVAGNKIYAYDTSGKVLSHFPIILSDTITLKGVSLADYEGNGKFRILVNDRGGNIYMFDAQGKNLEGWTPRKLAPLSSPVRHIRVKAKDYFIALQKDGRLSVLNRRGEMYKGFPLPIGKSCSSPAHIEIGKSPDKTFIYALSDEGTLIKLNLQGSVLEKTLFTRDLISKCRLLPSPGQESFVVSVVSGGQVLILNSSGAEIFQTSIPETDAEVSYQNLKDLKGLSIYTKEGDVSLFYLFDEQWKNIFKVPEFHGRVVAGESETDIIIFKFSHNTVEMGNIKLKKSENIR